MTYLNARKNPESWVKDGAMEATLYWLQPITWFNIGYAAIAAAVIWVLVSHMRRPTPLLSVSWHGKAQGLFLALLWSVVARRRSLGHSRSFGGSRSSRAALG